MTNIAALISSMNAMVEAQSKVLAELAKLVPADPAPVSAPDPMSEEQALFVRANIPEWYGFTIHGVPKLRDQFYGRNGGFIGFAAFLGERSPKISEADMYALVRIAWPYCTLNSMRGQLSLMRKCSNLAVHWEVDYASDTRTYIFHK